MSKFFNNAGNWIMMGFVCAALGMLFLAYKAINVKFDMVVEGDYYQLETNYNDVLKAKSNAYKIGDLFSFKANGDQLTLKIPEHLSQDLTDGYIEFYCVSNSDHDHIQKLNKKANGTYLFNRSEIAKGNNYLVKVGFTSEEKQFYKEFKMQ